MSSRDRLLTESGSVMQQFMACAVLYQDAVARQVGLNGTDLQALGVLVSDGPTSPGRLAQRTGISAGGAITQLIDRLERAAGAAGDATRGLPARSGAADAGYAAAATPTVMSRILSATDLALIHANPNRNMRTFLRQYRLRQGANGMVATARFDGGEAGVSGFTFPKVAHQTDIVVVDDTYGYLIANVKR